MTIRITTVNLIVVKSLLTQPSEMDVDYTFNRAQVFVTFRRVNSIRLSQNGEYWIFYISENNLQTCKNISIHKNNIMDFEIFES